MTEGIDALATVQWFVARLKRGAEIGPETSLLSEGLKLDSLELAELSALLEDRYGSDPFSDGQMPETVGEIIAFYDAPATVR